MSDDLWKASSTEDYEDDGEGADENGNWPLDKIVGEEVDYSGEILCAFLRLYLFFSLILVADTKYVSIQRI